MVRSKKAFIVFIITVSLAAVLLLCGSVLITRTPRNETISPADGSTVSKIARSYSENAWYYGDSVGNLVKLSEDGDVICETVVAEGRGIRSIFADRKYDGLLVLDEDYNLYHVDDTGEALELTFLKTFSGGYNAVTTDGEYFYFAVPVSRYTRFYKYAADDLAGDPVAQGQMYTCYKSGSNYVFQPVVSGSIVGMYTDSDYLYVVTGEGQYHRIEKGFSLCSYPYLSDEEMDELGATMASDGTVTLPGDNYDSSLYRTARKQLAANASAFDDETATFYVASADAELVALDTDFSELDGYSIDLPNTPASGGLAYHRESGTIYVAYSNLSTVSTVDAEKFEVTYEASVAFYISSMIVPEGGGRLIVICAGNDNSNPDYKILYSADIQTLNLRGTYKVLSIVSFCVGAAAAIIAVFTGLAAFRKGFAGACVKTMKGIVRNWAVYAILLVSLAALILYCYYPGIYSMILSLFDYTLSNPTMRFNNFENYIDIFTTSSNWIAFRNTLIFLAADIVLALIPPLIFAFCLAFMRSQRYSTIMRITMFIPSVLPGIATLLIWTQGIYGIEGVLNTIYKLFAGQDASSILFLQDYGIISLIMMGFPFVGSYLIFFGAMMNVPSSYYEAAELDGCSIWKRIVKIDLPMISSQIKYVFVLTFIQSVQNYSRVLMTTDGQFNTQVLPVLMYKALQTGDYGLSAAYATIMFLILIVATIFNMKIQTKDVEL